jgi:hypothetical protein
LVKRSSCLVVNISHFLGLGKPAHYIIRTLVNI